MEKIAKFEVPAEVLGDFMQEANRKGFSATTSGTTRHDDHIIIVPFEKDREDEIDELKEYLDDLISDYEQEEEEEEEEDEDERR